MLVIVVVRVWVPFIVVNVTKEYGTSVARPEPEGPRSSLACVGKIISEDTACVLFFPKAEPLVSPPVSSLSSPARNMESREKCPPTTGRALNSMTSGTIGYDPSSITSYRSVNGYPVDVKLSQ